MLSRQGAHQTGFSLLELMLVVAIIAILGTVGLPVYNEYLLKSQRTEARRALTEIALAQERAYTANGQYAATLGALAAAVGVSSTTAPYNGAGAAIDSKFAITLVTGVGDQSFTVSANKTSGPVDAQCGATMTLDNLGTQAAGAYTSECW